MSGAGGSFRVGVALSGSAPVDKASLETKLGALTGREGFAIERLAVKLLVGDILGSAEGDVC